jgi:hypothetical protein
MLNHALHCEFMALFGRCFSTLWVCSLGGSDHRADLPDDIDVLYEGEFLLTRISITGIDRHHGYKSGLPAAYEAYVYE